MAFELLLPALHFGRDLSLGSLEPSELIIFVLQLDTDGVRHL